MGNALAVISIAVGVALIGRDIDHGKEQAAEIKVESTGVGVGAGDSEQFGLVVSGEQRGTSTLDGPEVDPDRRVQGDTDVEVPVASVSEARVEAKEVPVRIASSGYRAYSREEIVSIICGYSWPCDEAVRVVYGPTPPNRKAPNGCPTGESGGNPRAHNQKDPNGGSFGLFGVNGIHAGKVGGNLQALFDPATNIRVAYQIWQDRGWEAWSCQP